MPRDKVEVPMQVVEDVLLCLDWLHRLHSATEGQSIHEEFNRKLLRLRPTHLSLDGVTARKFVRKAYLSFQGYTEEEGKTFEVEDPFAEM